MTLALGGGLLWWFWGTLTNDVEGRWSLADDPVLRQKAIRHLSRGERISEHLVPLANATLDAFQIELDAMSVSLLYNGQRVLAFPYSKKDLGGGSYEIDVRSKSGTDRFFVEVRGDSLHLETESGAAPTVRLTRVHF